jgi:hypothetical protein
MAQLRINQVPSTAEDVRESRSPHLIRLPALGDSLDQELPGPRMERAKAEIQANSCRSRLKQHPNQWETREKLARLLAEELEQPEPAIAELKLLLDAETSPPAKKPEWLSLMAAWHLRLRNDRPAARAILQRLVSEHPNTVQAMAARRRLELMKREGSDLNI